MARTWKTKIYSIESHPFGPMIFKDAKYLIVGTFPTFKKNRKYEFFYSGKGNLFWEVIEDIYKHKFQFYSDDPAVKERELFLQRKGLGIIDMHEICYRCNNSSSDESLFPIILTDIFKLLDNHNCIERIIFTSRTEVFGALVDIPDQSGPYVPG